ncbi:hypothetical protein D3C71_1827090 [compost metagenome]
MIMARKRGSTLNKAEVATPSRSTPASLCAARTVAPTAVRICPNSSRLSRRNTAPASVSLTSRRVRFNNRTPSSSSSNLMCCDRGGWDILSFSAARLKLSSSATMTK